MKNQLLVVLFALLSFSAFSQFSRSFYTEELNNRRFSSLVSVGGQTTVVSINHSGNDTLRVLLIDIDDRGETSNYRSYSYSPFELSTSYVLSGAGVNSLGDITLFVLSQNGSSNANGSCISVNPSNGVFSNYTFENGLYKRGYARSRTKGDSLITYLANSAGTGLLRVARSMTNTGISTESVDPTLTYLGDFTSNNVRSELIINGTDEYVALQSATLKRINANNYVQASSLAPFSSPCLAVTASGDLMALDRGGNTFKRFDSNLSLLSSGTLTGLQSPINGYMEMYALPNNAVRVWMSNGGSARVVDIDASNTLSLQQTSRSFPLDQIVLNGKQFVLGFDPVFNSPNDIDGNSNQSSENALAVVNDDLSNSLIEFTEYNQVVSTDKIEFHTGHNGLSFQNSSYTSAGFGFKQNNLTRGLLYSARQAIIGQNANGSLLGSSLGFENWSVTGPYTPLGNYSLEQMDKFNRGYFVTREMIDLHIAEITSGNPNYSIPFGIREWPAHGDVSLGQAANLANFFDQNSNGIYEPEQGDYPSIYGDQCLLNIYHQHPNMLQNASIETHQYYFTFDCDQEEAIENTVFMRTHNFARTETLVEAYVGSYADFDVGGAPDDYSGSNVQLGMIYGYNGDLVDEAANGATGFADTIPAVGLLTLRGAKLDPDGNDNAFGVGLNESINGMGFADGIADNEFYTQESAYLYGLLGGAQNTLISSYNTLKGLNPDGSPKQINGVTIRHDYFGTSDPLFYSSNGVDHGNNYSEAGGFNPPGDRRMIEGSGPMSLTTVDTLVLIEAFVVGIDTVNLSPANSVARLFEHGQTLRDFYIQNNSACGNNFDPYVTDQQLSTIEENIEQIVLYPNPASMSFKLKGIAGSGAVQIIDLNGRIVLAENDLIDGQEISIEELDTAVYLVSVEDENGKHVIRLVKR